MKPDSFFLLQCIPSSPNLSSRISATTLLSALLVYLTPAGPHVRLSLLNLPNRLSTLDFTHRQKLNLSDIAQHLSRPPAPNDTLKHLSPNPRLRRGTKYLLEDGNSFLSGDERSSNLLRGETVASSGKWLTRRYSCVQQ